MQHIDISEATFNKFNEDILNKTTVLIAKRDTGKTTTIIHDLYCQVQDKIDEVYIFSPTEKMTKSYLRKLTCFFI